MQQHTPGPWLRDGNTVYALTQQGWRKGEPVMVNRFMASVQGMTLAEAGEAEANATVMQAAPDMLDALDPDMLDAIANSLYAGEKSAIVHLRAVAKKQRAAMNKAQGK